MDLSSLIISGIAGMLILAVAVILFVVLYQRRVIKHQVEIKQMEVQKELELIQASIHSEEQERMRIASELHDDVGATLASARLFLHKTTEQEGDHATKHSKELLDESIQKIRSISHKLQPSTLYHLGLQTSLQSLCETINRAGIIEINYTSHQSLQRMEAQIELSVYRIAQELINNCIKHSKAKCIVLETNITGNRFVLILKHNGIGLSQQEYEAFVYKKGSIGLKNIVNRLKIMNASIAFQKGTDESFVKIEVPVKYA